MSDSADAGTPIGQATMLADGTIVLDLLRPAPARRTYAPADARHAEILAHVGGLSPGEQKVVPPWPDPFDAELVEKAVHAFVAEKKGWPRDGYRLVIMGSKATTVDVRVVHGDDRGKASPAERKSFGVDVDSTSYQVVREFRLP